MAYQTSPIADAADKIEAYLFAICKLYSGEDASASNEFVTLTKTFALNQTVDVVCVTVTDTGAPLVRVFNDGGTPRISYGDDVADDAPLGLVEPIREAFLQLVEQLTK